MSPTEMRVGGLGFRGKDVPKVNPTSLLNTSRLSNGGSGGGVGGRVRALGRSEWSCSFCCLGHSAYCSCGTLPVPQQSCGALLVTHLWYHTHLRYLVIIQSSTRHLHSSHTHTTVHHLYSSASHHLFTLLVRVLLLREVTLVLNVVFNVVPPPGA